MRIKTLHAHECVGMRIDARGPVDKDKSLGDGTLDFAQIPRRIPRVRLSGLRRKGPPIPVRISFYSFCCCGAQRGFRFYFLAFFCSFPTGPMSDGKNCNRRRKWAQKVVDLFKGMGPSDEWPHVLGTVAKTLGINSAPTPEPRGFVLSSLPGRWISQYLPVEVATRCR